MYKKPNIMVIKKDGKYIFLVKDKEIIIDKFEILNCMWYVEKWSGYGIPLKIIFNPNIFRILN